MSTFKDLKAEVRKVVGVSGCGGTMEQIVIHLGNDSPEVRAAVLAVIGDRVPADKVVFKLVGGISAGSEEDA